MAVVDRWSFFRGYLNSKIRYRQVVAIALVLTSQKQNMSLVIILQTYKENSTTSIGLQ